MGAGAGPDHQRKSIGRSSHRYDPDSLFATDCRGFSGELSGRVSYFGRKASPAREETDERRADGSSG